MRFPVGKVIFSGRLMEESNLPTINSQFCIIFPSKKPRLRKIGPVTLDNGESIAVIRLKRWLDGFSGVLQLFGIHFPLSIITIEYKCKKSSQQTNYLFKSKKISSKIKFTIIKRRYNLQKPKLSEKILAWYDQNKRDLPWRAGPGKFSDPYYVWISEIMLQQTGVATVIPYYLSFIDRWPAIGDLAKADLDSVLHEWQGLGYYARARNLHKAANEVLKNWDGQLPEIEEDLLKLPGIGPYTAAAIMAIAFDKYSLPIDVNIERVINRLSSENTSEQFTKTNIKSRLSNIMPNSRFSDFVQALMDLGAMICRPKKPICIKCPCSSACGTFLSKSDEKFEYKKFKKMRKELNGVVFWITRNDGSVLLRRRANSGLLGGMIEFPSTQWRENEWEHQEACNFAPIRANFSEIPGVISHTFSHFRLKLRLLYGSSKMTNISEGIWAKPSEFKNFAFPTLMKKVFIHYRKNV